MIDSLDISDQQQQQLPVILKGKTKLNELLSCLAKPYKIIYQDLLDYRDAIYPDAIYSNQTQLLESVLNRKYSPLLGGIKVVNVGDAALFGTYVGFDDSVGTDYWLAPEGSSLPDAEVPWLGTEDYYNDLHIDFIVYVPDNITFTTQIQDQMKALLNKVKPFDKNYIIELYTP